MDIQCNGFEDCHHSFISSHNSATSMLRIDICWECCCILCKLNNVLGTIWQEKNTKLSIILYCSSSFYYPNVGIPCDVGWLSSYKGRPPENGPCYRLCSSMPSSKWKKDILTLLCNPMVRFWTRWLFSQMAPIPPSLYIVLSSATKPGVYLMFLLCMSKVIAEQL